jgi:hypothetical protein
MSETKDPQLEAAVPRQSFALRASQKRGGAGRFLGRVVFLSRELGIGRDRYKGFYYFLDMQSRKRIWQSEMSLIDSALLLVGLLTAGAYFTDNWKTETESRGHALVLTTP